MLHALARAGVLHSTRGKRGGLRIARPTDRVSLLDVVSSFEALTGRRRCIVGRPDCSDDDPCPMHESWKATAARVAEFFSGTTLADVVREVAPGKPGRKRAPRASVPSRRVRR